MNRITALRITALRDGARYAQYYADGQEAIKNQTGARKARSTRTILLNMADELETAQAADLYPPDEIERVDEAE